MLPPHLSTERLKLRPLVAGDAEAIAEGLADWEVIRWLTAPPHPYGLADADGYIARQAGQGEGAGRAYAVDDGTGLIGVVGLDRRNAAINLGYWLRRDRWSLGYMTEAARAVVDTFFETRKDIVLTSGILEGNRASMRIQERLGFVRVGEKLTFARPLGRRVAHVLTWLGRPHWEERRRFRVKSVIGASGPSGKSADPERRCC
jgi:RimJ/RimL family protein N-acetyltransferase